MDQRLFDQLIPDVADFQAVKAFLDSLPTDGSGTLQPNTETLPVSLAPPPPHGTFDISYYQSNDQVQTPLPLPSPSFLPQYFSVDFMALTRCSQCSVFTRGWTTPLNNNPLCSNCFFSLVKGPQLLASTGYTNPQEPPLQPHSPGNALALSKDVNDVNNNLKLEQSHIFESQESASSSSSSSSNCPESSSELEDDNSSTYSEETWHGFGTQSQLLELESESDEE